MVFFPIRDEGARGHDPITKGLIAANVVVFLYTLTNLDYFVVNFGTIPERIMAGEVTYTLLTSMFLHGGFMHLLGNMWYLWIFGDNVEGAFGRARYLGFYLVTGLAGSLLHIAADPASMIPAVGASGAISGVLGAYFALFPNNRVDAVTTVGVIAHVQVSAKMVIGVWFLIQFFFSGFSLLGAETGVAYLAHLGGFVAGYVLAKLFARFK